MFRNDAAEFIYTRTYSRWIESEGRRETWPETVERYINFIYQERGDKIPSKVIDKIRIGMLNLNVMPSMRAVWAAGPAAKKDNTVLYNCSFATLSSPEALAENLYILMCGTGWGFSVEKKYITQLPEIPTIDPISHTTFLIEDNRAGWAESLRYLVTNLYNGKDVEFDYSALRPKGARLITMGGRSSGPEPLIKLHQFVKDLFFAAQGRKLKSIELLDISNQIAEIVVVGGVRRSSEICLSDLLDTDVRDAKIWPFPLRRAMSNNSVVYNNKPDAVTFLKEWAVLAASGTGERGIFNLSSVKKRSPKRRTTDKIVGTNPCVIGSTEILTKEGYQRIDSLVEIPTEIWNGFEWSTVIPKITGNNQSILEISFSNAKKLICTEYHKFKINTVYKELTEEKIARQLELDDCLMEWRMPSGELVDKVYVTGIRRIGIADKVYCFNEPKRHLGIFNGIITGQCGEISLRDMEFCNLSEVVIREDDDLDTLMHKVETAVWIGAIQATFTYFPFLRPQWAQNCEEERLLGVSLTGQMDAPHLITPDILKALKQKAIKTAKHAADKLSINMPAAITCVKPSGTVSQLVDSASGIHPRYSQYYIRRYRISSTDPFFKMLRAQKVPMKPETGQQEADANTWVVEFPIKSPDGCITKDSMTALEQLEHYKKVQTNWCEHNASCTIYVRDEEWFEVGNWVYKNWDYICGVSFLPADGGKYELAPYETITEDTYTKLAKAFPVIDYSQLSKFELEDQTEGAKNLACLGNTCEL